MPKPDSLYKYTKLEYVNSTLINGIIASPVGLLNDPYEYHGIENCECRVVCLSRSRNQKLMWSHYADGHKGCSIKVALPDDYDSETCPLKRVTYSSRITDRKNLKGADLAESLYIKDKKWSRELEVRAVYSKESEKSGRWKKYRKNIFFKVDITQIDLGCVSHLDSHYLDALIAIRDYNSTHGKKIKVKKYKMSDKKFEFIYDKEFNYLDEIDRITNGED